MARKVPVPLSFIIVVSIVSVVCIFFGAWAVSVDETNQENEFALTVNNIRPNLDGSTVRIRNEFAAGDTILIRGSSADTWWGSSLLMACPLH